MSRLLLAVLCVLLLVPAAAAQAPTGATSSLSIDNLPDEVEGNSSVQFVPFDVTLQTSNIVCLIDAGSFTVALAATATEAGNSTGNGTVTVTVNPSVLTFSVSTQEALRPASSTQSATLVVSVPAVSEGSREFELNVTANFPGGTGGCANPVPAASATDSVEFRFGRDAALDLADRNDGRAQPGPGLVVLVAGLVALALLRRK